MEEELAKEKTTIFGKIRRVVTKKIPAWVIVLILAVVVGGSFIYDHAKQDHQSIHVMVNLFNTCLAKPECNALFTPAQKAATAPGK